MRVFYTILFCSVLCVCTFYKTGAIDSQKKTEERNVNNQVVFILLRFEWPYALNGCKRNIKHTRLTGFIFSFSKSQMACTCHCSGAEPVSLSPTSQVSGGSGMNSLQQQQLRETSTTSSHYFTPVSSFNSSTVQQHDDSKEPDSLEYRPGPSS